MSRERYSQNDPIIYIKYLNIYMLYQLISGIKPCQFSESQSTCPTLQITLGGICWPKYLLNVVLACVQTTCHTECLLSATCKLHSQESKERQRQLTKRIKPIDSLLFTSALSIPVPFRTHYIDPDHRPFTPHRAAAKRHLGRVPAWIEFKPPPSD